MRLTWRRADGAACPRVEKGTDYHYIAGEFTQKVYDKLAAYEDAEEQGRLVRLPCDVGDMVWYRRGKNFIGDTVRRIVLDEHGNHVVLDCHNKEFDFEEFGKTVFASWEAAEAALKGGQGDV